MSSSNAGKMPYEMVNDPVLGPLASAVNSVNAGFLMIQTPEANRSSWLRSIVANSDAVAAAARELLEVKP